MNLIICCTPLQVLIAEKIIERYHEEEFCGIMLDSYDNDKFKFYAKKLERLCSTFHFIRRPTSRFKRYKSLFSLLKFKNKEFNNVFLASVDKRSIHIILTKIKFNELYTFDDGSANLDKNSALYKDPPVFSNLRFMNIILGNKFNTKKIKKYLKNITLFTHQKKTL